MKNPINLLRDTLRDLSTSPKTDVSSSKDEDGNEHWKVNLPTEWNELTQKQLYYICALLSLGIPMDQLKIYALIRFLGLNVIGEKDGAWMLSKRFSLFKSKYFSWSSEDVTFYAESMSFLDALPAAPTAVMAFGKYRAIDTMLHIPFEEYLIMENLWQGYLSSKLQEPLVRITKMLYKDSKGNAPDDPSPVMCAAASLWYSSWKEMCYINWPYLFKKGEGGNEPVNMMESMNNMIRGLSEGDVTKEKEILKVDVWRAFTELDAKVKESDEQRRQLKSMNR